ncbi:hypothetical protein [Coleofasciculus sp. FACHB-SPT36]|uniref:hypothetical protein n=1 Tax=Cyanophyceae TaxID=3028117 RepID=UPI00168BA421|nr:hypothetical protein [Coleofasciculus sp. FACHB-SPT36]MBD2539809.1 hypothetical protein [Coleofasciculus sp. FACHB-SPT36]
MELGAVGCVACGTPIGEAGVASNTCTQTPLNKGIQDVPLNTLKFVEKSKGHSCSFEASLTNEMGTSLGGTALAAIIGRTSNGIPRNGHAKGQNIYSDETQQLSLFDLNQNQDEIVVNAPIQHTLPPAESRVDAEKLRDIFRYNGEQLRLKETRLKANNKLDASRRLVYLFLYAHELEGRHEIPRTVLNEELKKAGYYATNVVTWISKSSDLFREEDRVGLQKSGREEAQKVLAEILDPNIQSKWSLNTGGGTRGAKSNGQGDESADSSPKNGSRKSNSFSQTVESWVTAWKTLSLNIDGFAAIKDRSTSEKGIFALWAVGKATSEPEQVASSYMIAQFLYLTFGIKVSERNLGRSLGEIAGQGALIKVQGGFKLLSPGIAEAEKMAGFAPNISQTTNLPQDSENSP